MLLLSAAIGGLTGATGGFAAGIVERSRRRWANARRCARGEPPSKNEARPPLAAPGALLGALASALCASRWGVSGGALAGFAVPVLGWNALLVLGTLAVRLERIGRARRPPP